MTGWMAARFRLLRPLGCQLAVVVSSALLLLPSLGLASCVLALLGELALPSAFGLRRPLPPPAVLAGGTRQGT